MMSLLVDLKLTTTVTWNLILKTNRAYLLAILFVAILFALQWLFNIDQLLDIVLGDNPLSLGERIDFLVDGFINIFRFIDDFIPVAMILIALMQAITLTLFISFGGSKKLRSQQALPLGLSFIGVGCVACGGSILTPLLGLVASNVSIAFAESVSNILLAVALLLSFVSMNKTAYLVAKTVPRATR